MTHPDLRPLICRALALAADAAAMQAQAPPLPPMAASRLECLARDCAAMADLLRKLQEARDEGAG
jgi:hypothetical protein